MIRKILLTFAVLALPATSLLAVASPVQAALFDGAKEQACEGAGLGTTSDCNDDANGAGRVQEVIQNIVNILTIIVGIVAVILIIVNGFKFVTSNGDSNAVTSAKNGLIYAIVGLIVVALAQIIVRFVLERIL